MRTSTMNFLPNKMSENVRREVRHAIHECADEMHVVLCGDREDARLGPDRWRHGGSKAWAGLHIQPPRDGIRCRKPTRRTASQEPSTRAIRRDTVARLPCPPVTVFWPSWPP